MSYIGKNIKKIRTVKNLSQSAFAQLFNLARPSIGAYEEGRSEPKIETILQIAQHFGISVDMLLTRELTINEFYGFDIFKKGLKKEEALKKGQTDNSNLCNIPYAVKDNRKTYLQNFTEKAFLNTLPTLTVPLKNNNTSYRAFEVITEDLNNQDYNFKEGDILICQAQETGSKSKQNQVHVLVTEKDLLIRKTDYQQAGSEIADVFYFELKNRSDQPHEIWDVQAIIQYPPYAAGSLEQRVSMLEDKVKQLSERLDK